MRNILWGIALVIAGGSGHFALRGTDSPMLLVLVGVVLFLVGLLQLGASSSEVREGSEFDADTERDAEQWEEYERSKLELLERQARAQKEAEVDALVKHVPGAKARIAEVLRHAGEGLSDGQRHELALDLARRLRAEQEQGHSTLQTS